MQKKKNTSDIFNVVMSGWFVNLLKKYVPITIKVLFISDDVPLSFNKSRYDLFAAF